MLKLQAYKFQLRTKPEQEAQMRRFAGCCRFVWNNALALEKEEYAKSKKRLGYSKVANMLPEWKKCKYSFLSEAPSQTLQQALKDLDKAYRNFFAKRADFPKFKEKGVHDAFRYPQGFSVDNGNGRVFLPKIGWVRYRKSRDVLGTPKNVTVILEAGKWYVSIQTEMEIGIPVHPSNKTIGLDMGITHFVALSDGHLIAPRNSFKASEKKLVRLQRRLAKCKKFSKNWQKIKTKIAKLHRKIACMRQDFLHKLSTDICKTHALVVMEDLKVRNMSQSASGTVDSPGRNVRAKAVLNKRILDQGWSEFRRQIVYKSQWLGGQLVLVNPAYTSQSCNNCGCINKDNRPTQTKFKCVSCGHEDNADVNAARNILAAGLAVSACGEERARASSAKQEPSKRVA